MKCVKWAVVAFFLSLTCSLLSTEKDSTIRKIQSQLLIGDCDAALTAIQQVIKSQPEDLQLGQLYMHVLAVKGEESKLLAYYEKFRKKFPEKAYEKKLLEEICWCILKKGRESSSITIRLASLVGGALTNDILGMHFVLDNLQESNLVLRGLAIEFSTAYRDLALKEEVIRLFWEEKSWQLRLKVIEAIGVLKIEEMEVHLLKLIENDRSSIEEKVAAAVAIAKMRDGMKRQEIQVLVKSKRAGLRMLACEAVGQFLLEEEVDLILPLINDDRTEVKAAALKALGLLRVKVHEDKPILFYISKALNAYDPVVGITAAWVLLLADPQAAESYIMKWIHHPSPDVAALAASLLRVSGPYGTELAYKILKEEKDGFVRLNAAIALICERKHVEEACGFLYDFFQDSNQYWMEDKEINGIFSPIRLSDVKVHPTIANYPEVMNQKVRLDILNLLAMMQWPKAQQAIKLFLKERTLGITGIAAEMLLEEGDESALELVRELLQDSSQHIRVQAALVLAVWGHDLAAVPTLIEAYQNVDRQTKIKILEALCKIGSEDAICFLVDHLKEQSQIVRILDAAALILALNH